MFQIHKQINSFKLCYHCGWLIQEWNIIHNYPTCYLRIITSSSFGHNPVARVHMLALIILFIEDFITVQPLQTWIYLNTICYILPKIAKSILLDKGMLWTRVSRFNRSIIKTSRKLQRRRNSIHTICQMMLSSFSQWKRLL